MNTSFGDPEFLKQLTDEFGIHSITLPATHSVHLLGVNFDAEMQLRAIQDLLAIHRDVERSEYSAIEALKNSADATIGIENCMINDSLVERFELSPYQDAARSMAAVGMLAPFMETIFYQCFMGIHKKFYPFSNPASKLPRWASNDIERWNCRCVPIGKRWKPNVLEGIFELIKSVGLEPRMPTDLRVTLNALIAYRNKMFHNGFEWPIDERKAFQGRTDKKEWPAAWFRSATEDGEPQIFYMTEQFIDHVLETTKAVLDAFANYARDEIKAQKAKKP